MAGELDLARLLQGLKPRLHPDRHAFAATDDSAMLEGQFALIREDEGLTSIHPDDDGSGRGSAWKFIPAWRRSA